MPATLIDGKAVAAEVRSRLAEEAAELTDAGRTPHLVAVQVGENPASRLYTEQQRKTCEAIGVGYHLLELPAETTQRQISDAIEELNADTEVTGVILQMPTPEGIDTRAAQAVIDPVKDVEAVTPVNMEKLFYGDCVVAPCTPMAAIDLLRRAAAEHWGGEAPLAGREAVVIGHSEIVGKPMAMMLLARRDTAPTVTVCHIATRSLAEHTRRAEVLIVAVGASQRRWLRYRDALRAGDAPERPDLSPLIGAEMLRPGAIVIDVAINRIPRALDADGRAVRKPNGKADMITAGDVDFDAAREKVAAITPVPGGVGPVTVAMLLRNTIACAARQV